MRDVVLYTILFICYLTSLSDAQIIPQPDTVYTDSTGTLVADGQYWYQGETLRQPYINNEIILYFNDTASQTQRDSIVHEFDLIVIRPELSYSDPYIFCTQEKLAALVAQTLREFSSVEYVYPLIGNHGRRESSGHLHYKTEISIRVQAEWDSLQITEFEKKHGLSFIEFHSGLGTYEVRLNPPTGRHILEVTSQINLDSRVIRAYPSVGGSPNRIGLPADFNFDGRVDFEDLIIFVQYYGREFRCRTEGIDCDLDFNYKVDFADFLKFAAQFSDSR